jgi:hypothetical protein
MDADRIVYPDVPQDVDLEYYPDLDPHWEDPDALLLDDWPSEE